ncbi:hypothetical protein ACOSQ4_018778 [Xanthoceras sorbifolium]
MRCPKAKIGADAVPSLPFRREPSLRSLTRGASPLFRKDLPHFFHLLLLSLLRAITVKGRRSLLMLQQSSLLDRGCPPPPLEWCMSIRPRTPLLIWSASLAYKDMLETESNEAKRRELRDEVVKIRGELAPGVERKKQLAAVVNKSHAINRSLELEVKGSTDKINELQVNLERFRGELDRSRELVEKLKDESAKKGEELVHKEKGFEKEKVAL